MRKKMYWMTFLFVATLFAGSALADDLIVFPAKGQSEEQIEMDKFTCYSWAKKESGFDPMEIPKASEPPPKQQAGKGGGVKGAAVGAGIGWAVGRASGQSVSKGAKIGAAAGGLLGGMRQKKQRQADEQARKEWEQKQAEEYMYKRNTYNRAYAACLEAKGYTVK